MHGDVVQQEAFPVGADDEDADDLLVVFATSTFLSRTTRR
jgi:hypothetical protein